MHSVMSALHSAQPHSVRTSLITTLSLPGLIHYGTHHNEVIDKLSGKVAHDKAMNKTSKMKGDA